MVNELKRMQEIIYCDGKPPEHLRKDRQNQAKERKFGVGRAKAAGSPATGSPAKEVGIRQPEIWFKFNTLSSCRGYVVVFRGLFRGRVQNSSESRKIIIAQPFLVRGPIVGYLRELYYVLFQIILKTLLMKNSSMLYTVIYVTVRIASRPLL